MYVSRFSTANIISDTAYNGELLDPERIWDRIPQ
jgi:hypothetical protein